MQWVVAAGCFAKDGFFHLHAPQHGVQRWPSASQLRRRAPFHRLKCVEREMEVAYIRGTETEAFHRVVRLGPFRATAVDQRGHGLIILSTRNSRLKMAFRDDDN